MKPFFEDETQTYISKIMEKNYERQLQLNGPIQLG